MNNILSIISLIFISRYLIAQAPDPMVLKKDIVDYYWEMASEDKDLVSYPLEIKEKKWTTVSIADYELEAYVNTSKGYIEINDPGNDSLDKASYFQFKVFQWKKSNPVIVISKKKYAEKLWSTEVSFWQKKGGKWFDVSQEISDDLSYQDFLEGGRDGFKYGESVAKMLPIHYDLPKKGNAIKIYLLSDYFSYYCHQVKPDDIDCGIQGAIIYDQVTLQWHKGKGEFKLGEFKKAK